jgi:hypothetical protein
MAREFKDDEALEQMLLEKRDFQQRIEPQVRERIKELVSETDKEWALQRRKDFLVMLIADFERWLYWKNWQYALAFEADQIVWGRCLLEEISIAKECLADLTGKLRYLRPSEDRRAGEITDDMIQRAREYPFESLLTFKNEFACCPVHGERTASLKLYRDKNRVHCFGACGKGYDTIDFLMITENLPFADAVRRLQ